LAVLEAIGRSEEDWSDLTVRQDSLEEVFVKLVGSQITEEGQVAVVN
jgi:hypothetical protein